MSCISAAFPRPRSVLPANGSTPKYAATIALPAVCIVCYKHIVPCHSQGKQLSKKERTMYYTYLCMSIIALGALYPLEAVKAIHQDARQKSNQATAVDDKNLFLAAIQDLNDEQISHLQKIVHGNRHLGVVTNNAWRLWYKHIRCAFSHQKKQPCRIMHRTLGKKGASLICVAEAEFLSELIAAQHHKVLIALIGFHNMVVQHGPCSRSTIRRACAKQWLADLSAHKTTQSSSDT